MNKNQPVTVLSINESSGFAKQLEYPNFKQACMFTAMSLVDNGHADKKTAQTWQATIKGLGEHRFNSHLVFMFAQ